MAQDRIYLLKPGFKMEGRGPYFCAACATVEGMLSFYPDLRDKVDVRYIGYERPRPDIVAEIGEENQSTPVLVLGEGSTVPDGLHPQEANGNRFLNDEYEILHYLAARFAVAQPEGELSEAWPKHPAGSPAAAPQR